MDLSGRHLILGMTGGIAAYKACELVRRLRDAGASVRVVMTRAAQDFATPTPMQAPTPQPASTEQPGRHGGPEGNPTRGADAIVVAPASAHFLARTAQGLADDLLSTLVLARTCPLLAAPAMNVEMWSNPATQRNVQLLRGDGVVLLGPGEGAQACGETGSGRMLEAHELLEEIVAFFQPKLLRGRRVLMTAGPTFEPIDPVRGITNLSSGKMGFALARAAREAGADVVLVAGPTALPTPRGLRRIDVQTAAQMQAAVMSEVAAADIFIGVAAVADWRVANAADAKLKKGSGAPSLQFEANPDILATVAAGPSRPFCVGFAAETDNVVPYAQAKLASKRLDMVVANRAQDVFGADAGELFVVDAAGVTALPADSKLAQARRLVAAIAGRLPAQTKGR